jgi:cyanophycinase-like exopeptidase
VANYILHGGKLLQPSESNDALFKLIATELSGGGLCLAVFFARDESKVPALYTDHVKRIKDSLGTDSDKVSFELADLNKLPTQIKAARLVYIAGGNTNKLRDALGSVANIKSLLSRDIAYVGSSAGMYILGNTYVDEECGSGTGFGVLNYHMMAHHMVEAYAAAQSDFEKLTGPKMLLHETQFVVIKT